MLKRYWFAYFLIPFIEILLEVDREISSCCSGGVEIVGLHTTMVQKRQVKQIPTLEYVHFVPYGEIKSEFPDNIANYSALCKQYLSLVLRDISSVNQTVLFDSSEKTEKINDIDNYVSKYLNDEECGYIKVLYQVRHLKKSGDFVKAALNIFNANAVQLSRDKLLSSFTRDGAFKNLLDVVWENLTSRKLTVVEIGARYGGLFMHIVPCFMSEPLLQLEYIATDTNVSTLPTDLMDQLQVLNVKQSHFDINDDKVSGFSNKSLVVVRGLAQQSECITSALEKIHSLIAAGGFLLLLEVTSNFELHCGVDEIIHRHARKDLQERQHGIYLTSAQWKEKIESCGLELIQQLCDSLSSTVFLCRKVENVSKYVFIPVSMKKFDWVEDLKLELSEDKSDNDCDRNIWLVAYGDYHSGILGMVNCLRKEDGGHKIR